MSEYRFDRLKLLVVDDNAHLRKLVVTILQAFGIVQISQATDGSQAWTLVRSDDPDIIILDWMMQGMSGVEFTKIVRTSSQTPNPFVPIIMLTGHTRLEYIRQARDAGVNEFLAKPVSINAIMTRLVSVIERPREFVRANGYFGPNRRRRGGDEYPGLERRGTGKGGVLN